LPIESKSANSNKPKDADTIPATVLPKAIVVCLNTLSFPVDEDSLFAGISRLSKEDDWRSLERAINRIGYVSSGPTKAKISQLNFPICILLNNGLYAVVLDKQGDRYLIADPRLVGSVSFASTALVNKMYAGYTISISPSIQEIQRRYTAVKTEGHWFWSRIFDRPVLIVESLVAAFLANSLAVLVSLFAMQVYDRVIPSEAFTTLWLLTAGTMIGILFEGVLRVERASIIDRIGTKAESQISQHLFSRVLGMRLDRKPGGPGDIVYLMREISSVKDFFTSASVGVLSDIPFVAIFLVLIYFIAGSVVWVVLLGCIVTLLAGAWTQWRMSTLNTESQAAASSTLRMLTETVYGLESVRTGQLEGFLSRQWEEVGRLTSERTSEQRRLMAQSTYFAAALQQVTYVFCVVAGVYLVFEAQLTVGAMIAVGILTSRTLSPITQISQVIARWQSMSFALRGLDTIEKSEQERHPNSVYIRRPRLSGRIELREAQYSHKGRTTLSLDLPDVEIGAGDRVAVVGPSGSGKSTLLRLVAGLYSPSRGSVFFDGLEERQVDPNDLRKNVGFLSADIRLHRGSLRQNLKPEGSSFSDDMIYQALEFGGLSDFIARNPEGLDIQISDGGDAFSTGQRQSIALAKLYLQDPAILVLDEPTSSLDAKSEADFVNRLGAWVGNRTLIFATHRSRMLSIAGRVLVLKDGRLVISGPRDEVISKVSGNHGV
jgi:ATP-binding cassette, subfamily C, bacterial LapB